MYNSEKFRIAGSFD